MRIPVAARARKSAEYTLLRSKIVCVSHEFYMAPPHHLRLDTLLHLKKCGFWHFCAPSGRPQISRTPMFSCLILQSCDFLKSIIFALACARFRMPARTRTRKAHARERELPTFPKSQNREMRQGNIGVRENPSRREGTKKFRNNTFEKKKYFLVQEVGHLLYTRRSIGAE